MKNYIMYVLFMCIPILASEEIALKQIYDNRMALSEFFQNTVIKVGDEVFVRSFNGKSEFLAMVQKPFETWQSKKDIVFEAFYSSCDWLSKYSKNNNSYVINNDLYVAVLIELLQAGHSVALNRLIGQTSFKLLKKNSGAIKSALGPLPFNDVKKYQLYVLLDLSEKEKLALDSFSLSRTFQAKLGNKKQEDSLINDYYKATDYRSKRDLAKSLCYVGSDTCIKVLISDFNKPIFDILWSGVPWHPGKTTRCVKESIRYPILEGLRQMFPENSLFNSELDQFDPLFGLRSNIPDSVTAYVARFKTWAKVTYNIIPVDQDPEPIFKGVCFFID